MFKKSLLHIVVCLILLAYLIIGTIAWIKVVIGITAICFVIICVRQFFRDMEEINSHDHWVK